MKTRLEEPEATGPITTTNIKQGPDLHRININPHIKGLFTSYLLSFAIYLQAREKEKNKCQGMPKARETQSEETEQWSEQNSDMTQMLEVSQSEFKITIVNMLMILMEKVNNIQEQMGTISRRGKGNIRKNQNKILGKNPIT